jgi:hypothetical protein
MYSVNIIKPFFDIQGRKYIIVELQDKTRYQIKIPFRYNRVMCNVRGHIPIQEFVEGQFVRIEIRKKTWNGLEYYVLESICPLPAMEKQYNQLLS